MPLPTNADVDTAIPALPSVSNRADLLAALLKDFLAYVAALPTSTLTAAGISFTPSGNISATNLQTAVVELDSEKLAAAAVGVSVAPLDGDGKVPSANLPAGVAGITSFNGRNDVAAVPAAGDYDTSMVSASGSATNYTPTVATAAGHLAGIDTALAARVLTGDSRLTDARTLLAGTTVPRHRKTVTTETAPYIYATTNLGTVLYVTSAGTVTIPSFATLGDGDGLIKNDSSGTVVLDGTGGTNVSLAAGEAATLLSGNGKVDIAKGALTTVST